MKALRGADRDARGDRGVSVALSLARGPRVRPRSWSGLLARAARRTQGTLMSMREKSEIEKWLMAPRRDIILRARTEIPAPNATPSEGATVWEG